MSTNNLQKNIYNALVAAPGLSEVGVTKYYADYNGIYPFIVYREISNVPAMHADNVVSIHRPHTRPDPFMFTL